MPFLAVLPTYQFEMNRVYFGLKKFHTGMKYNSLLWKQISHKLKMFPREDVKLRGLKLN